MAVRKAMKAPETKDANAKKPDTPSIQEQFEEQKSRSADIDKKLTELSGLVSKFAENQANDNDGGVTDKSREEKMQNQITLMEDQIKSMQVEAAGLNGGSDQVEEVSYKAACDALMRKGTEGPNGMTPEEQKALSTGADADGGYIVYDEESNEIIKGLDDLVPMRKLARKISIKTNQYKQPKKTRGTSAGWVGETDPPSNTQTPQLGRLDVPVMEMEATPEATLQMLEDASINVEAWLAGEVRTDFASLENTGFFKGTGSGNNQPEGINAYAGGYVDNGSWVAGKIGTVSTGASGAFGATPHDNIIDLITSLEEGYQNNATFVMNRLSWGDIMKIKDGDGNPLYMKPTEGLKARWGTILGYPIELTGAMTNIGANSRSIALGDFNEAYLIVDRMGVTVMRDPYSNKPYVQFYTRKRVGGGVRQEAAVKFLQFSE
jgi:HK97 family phage major capsid protein